MEHRARLSIGLVVVLAGAGCAERASGDDEDATNREACGDECPEETGGRTSSDGSSTSGLGGNAGNSSSPDDAASGAEPSAGGSGDSPSSGGSSSDTGESGASAIGGESSVSGMGGESGAPATSEDAGSPSIIDPEPGNGPGGGPATNGGGAAGDEAGPEPEMEPEMPPDDSGPASSRLTARPIDTTDAALGYWEYLPPGYSSGPVPLLVFTHGAAWQGAGTLETLQELLDVGPPNLISTDAWPNDRPFLVLAPQNPHSGCFTSEDIDGFYRYALANYDVDVQRIYHTGQSCGAIGAWNYLAEHLDEFVTAAVLISGDGQPAFEQAGCDLARISIWGLHNENDASVDSMGTIVPINGLLECDPPPDDRLTIYPDASEHDAWTKTYDLSEGNDIYAWLLEHVHP